MKQTLLSVIFLIFVLAGYAQPSFHFEQDTVIIENIDTTAEIIIHNPCFNDSDVSETYNWERIIVQMPETPWSSLVCEQVCHVPAISSANFTVSANGSITFDFHITPESLNDGDEVEVHLKVKNLADTNQVVTLVYIFRVGTIQDVDDSGATIVEPILVYPNPTFDFINIKNGESVERLVVYNIMGRAIKTFYANGLRSFDISELAEGMYLVGFFDENNNIIKTTRVSKRSLMP